MDVKGVGEAADVHQGDVALAALDTSPVVSVQTGARGELLLREPRLPAALAERKPKPLEDIRSTSVSHATLWSDGETLL